MINLTVTPVLQVLWNIPEESFLPGMSQGKKVVISPGY